MTRKSKPRRACKLCKPHKYAGNGSQRFRASVLRRLGGRTRRVR